MSENIDSLISLYKLDYEKAIEISLKLETTKLTYQKFFISLVALIGTISIAFLKLQIFSIANTPFKIETLSGLLLIFATIIGYIIVKNLVSVRKQSVFYNNAIVYLREQLIEKLNLGNEYPSLKKVPANHKDSADYLTILLYSLINLIMFISGICLMINYEKMQILQFAILFTLIPLTYILLHYFTIEKILKKEFI